MLKKYREVKCIIEVQWNMGPVLQFTSTKAKGGTESESDLLAKRVCTYKDFDPGLA